MTWTVEFHPEFLKEYSKYAQEVQDSVLVKAKFLQEFGANLGRPYVDTLKNSKHSNMKELRLDAGNGVWRVAFAFDPNRKAILLIAGDKSGVNQSRFYKKLINSADARFDEHLDNTGKV